MNENNYNISEYLYLGELEKILKFGDERQCRNSITKSIFGIRMVFDLTDNTIPIITTKKMSIKTIIKELLWFISGDTNNETLNKQGVHIWDGNSKRDEDSNEYNLNDNDLGPIYGFQWRHWGANYTNCHDNYENKGIDQLQECINSIKNSPASRRMMVSAWNVSDIKKMALPPCHSLFQWYVSSNNELSLQLYQRSGDMFLGVPFNILSYSLLVHMVAHLTNLKPGKFIHIIGDAHIYENQYHAVNLQLQRKPFEFPKLNIRRKVESIDDFKLDDFEILKYECHDAIKVGMIA
jgi:thymidylate synthase